MSDTYEPIDGDLVNMTFQTRVGSEAYRLALCNQVSIERVQPVDDPSRDLNGTLRTDPVTGRTAVCALFTATEGGETYRCWIEKSPKTPDWRLTDDQVVGWKISGAWPRTPAAEAELERSRNGAGSAAGIYNWDEIYGRTAAGKQAADELSRQQDDEEPRRHEFEASYSGMVCGRMVMRDGGGDSCGQPANAPVHERKLWTGDGSEEPPAHVKKVRDKHGCVAERKGDGWQWISGPGTGPKEWGTIACGPYIEVRD